jgi:tetratricopeptide (TPR) repeat protein
MEDGTPPPDSVVIERVCNGTPRPESYTDSKGRFSFELGRNAHMMMDASVGSASGGFGDPLSRTRGESPLSGPPQGHTPSDLMGCELRASLPGYRSDVVILSGRRLFDNPDVGTIVLHRLGDVEGSTISLTSLQAPKKAKKSYQKGLKAVRKQKWAAGQKEFEKAVEIYPGYAAAWFQLGRSLEQQDNLAEARKAYGRALASDEKFLNPYFQLTGIAMREQKWQEVVETTDRIVKLNAINFPAAYFYNSVANYNLKNFEAAENSAREALKLDTQHQFPKIDHVLGVILAQRGDLASAAQHMRSYLKLVPEGSDADTVKQQLTEIERFVGPPKATEQQPQQ